MNRLQKASMVDGGALPKNRRKHKWSAYWLPAALIILGLVPAVGGTFRLTQLATSAEITPANARFFAAPIPVTLHIIGAVLYSILGAFQFSPTFRRTRRQWHRMVGRMLIPAGFVVALSGLWMTQFYPWPELDGVGLYVVRLIVGVGMLATLIMGVITVRGRKFRQHGAWMIRAYALAMAAGTQVLTHIPLLIFPSALNETTRLVAMTAGWVINIVVAEWVIRNKRL